MDDEDAMSDNSVPFGYGASAFGSEGEEEEEDVAVHRESALRHMEWETAAERYIITTMLITTAVSNARTKAPYKSPSNVI